MNKRKQRVLSSLLAGALLLSTLLAVDAFGELEPKFLSMMCAGFVLIILAVFIGLFWQERARDERETALIHQSSRMAYLAGLVTLGLGFTVQMLQHRPDRWLTLTLVTMVLVKLLTRKP